MRSAHACPIARPLESTSKAIIASSRRRAAQGWARTVSPLSSPFRILAAVRPRSILGCFSLAITVGPILVMRRLTSELGLLWLGEGCSLVFRPIESLVRPPSPPSTPTSSVRTGDTNGVRS